MPARSLRTLEMRFWSKVYVPGFGFIADPNDLPRILVVHRDVCWEWRGARHVKGYGHFRVRQEDLDGCALKEGEVLRCNRLALTLVVGPAPLDKPYALHRCDNPPCVNPTPEKHLRWGTSSENNCETYARFRREPKRIELHGVQGEMI